MAINVILREPVVVAVSQPGEKRWGHHQFPNIYRLDDGRLAIKYWVEADSYVIEGLPVPLCVSADGGRTWESADPGLLDQSIAEGIVLPDGESIKFLNPPKTCDASSLALPKHSVPYTDAWTRRCDCYRLGDLPADLQAMPMLRRQPNAKAWIEDKARLEAPEWVVPVLRWEWGDKGWADPNLFIPPHIDTRFFWTVMPDGGILNFMYFHRFNADGTLPERRGVGVLRSDDRGRTWRLWGVPGYFENAEAAQQASRPHLENPASNYNRLWSGRGPAPIPNFESNGLYEPGVVSFGDGRLVCVLRSDTGGTHQPIFLARSQDWGKTWTTPEILAPFGVMPKLVLLDSGVIALVYGRPGVQLLFCDDRRGEIWHTPVNVLPEPAEKTRATVGMRGTDTTDRQVGHDDTCGNCTVLKTGPDRFLIAYSDFRHQTAAGLCKAIKVREVIVK